MQIQLPASSPLPDSVDIKSLNSSLQHVWFHKAQLPVAFEHSFPQLSPTAKMKLAGVSLVWSVLSSIAVALTAAQWRNQSIYFLLTDRFGLTSNSTTASCDAADGVSYNDFSKFGRFWFYRILTQSPGLLRRYLARSYQSCM